MFLRESNFVNARKLFQANSVLQKSVFECITDNQFLANYFRELVGNVAWNCFFKLGLLENNFLKENIRYSVSIRTYTISSFLFKVISAKRRKLYDFLQSYTYYICKEGTYFFIALLQ